MCGPLLCGAPGAGGACACERRWRASVWLQCLAGAPYTRVVLVMISFTLPVPLPCPCLPARAPSRCDVYDHQDIGGGGRGVPVCRRAVLGIHRGVRPLPCPRVRGAVCVRMRVNVCSCARVFHGALPVHLGGGVCVCVPPEQCPCVCALVRVCACVLVGVFLWNRGAYMRACHRVPVPVPGTCPVRARVMMPANWC